MDIWHIRNGTSRAFANPKQFQKVVLYLRGWRKFNALWWSKPSKRTKEIWGH